MLFVLNIVNLKLELMHFSCSYCSCQLQIVSVILWKLTLKLLFVNIFCRVVSN